MVTAPNTERRQPHLLDFVGTKKVYSESPAVGESHVLLELSGLLQTSSRPADRRIGEEKKADRSLINKNCQLSSLS